MTNQGMREVFNPSELFMTQRSEDMAGCSLVCALEGTRSIVAEIQALSTRSSLSNARRISAGIENARMMMLCALIDKKMSLKLYESDIYVNVVGGLRIDERSADLAVAASIVSSAIDIPVISGSVAIGEVGLTGEIRAVSQIEKRVQECARLGFKRVVIPKDNARNVKSSTIEIVSVDNIQKAMDVLLSR